MGRRNNSESRDPPHPHRWSSERDRLQQEKNEENCRPVAVCFLLLSLWSVPNIKQHWRKERCPDGQNCAQTIDNRQSDKPVFSKHDVFPHVCWQQYSNKIAKNYLYRRWRTFFQTLTEFLQTLIGFPAFEGKNNQVNVRVFEVKTWKPLYLSKIWTFLIKYSYRLFEETKATEKVKSEFEFQNRDNSHLLKR